MSTSPYYYSYGYDYGYSYGGSSTAFLIVFLIFLGVAIALSFFCASKYMGGEKSKKKTKLGKFFNMENIYLEKFLRALFMVCAVFIAVFAVAFPFLSWASTGRFAMFLLGIVGGALIFLFGELFLRLGFEFVYLIVRMAGDTHAMRKKVVGEAAEEEEDAEDEAAEVVEAEVVVEAEAVAEVAEAEAVAEEAEVEAEAEVETEAEAVAEEAEVEAEAEAPAEAEVEAEAETEAPVEAEAEAEAVEEPAQAEEAEATEEKPEE